LEEWLNGAGLKLTGCKRLFKEEVGVLRFMAEDL